MNLTRLFHLTTALAGAGFLLLASAGCQTGDSTALRGRPVAETINHPPAETLEALRAVLEANGYTVTRADARRGVVEASTRIGREHSAGHSLQRHARIVLGETSPGVTGIRLLLSLVEERPDAFGVPTAYQRPIRDPAEYRRFVEQLREQLGEPSDR